MSSRFKLDHKNLLRWDGSNTYGNNYMKFIARVDREASNYDLPDHIIVSKLDVLLTVQAVSWYNASLCYRQRAGWQNWKQEITCQSQRPRLYGHI